MKKYSERRARDQKERKRHDCGRQTEDRDLAVRCVCSSFVRRSPCVLRVLCLLGKENHTHTLLQKCPLRVTSNHPAFPLVTSSRIYELLSHHQQQPVLIEVAAPELRDAATHRITTLDSTRRSVVDVPHCVRIVGGLRRAGCRGSTPQDRCGCFVCARRSWCSAPLTRIFPQFNC